MKKSYFILVWLLVFGQLVSFAQIVNKGILQIENSTTVYFSNEYTNSVTGLHYNDGDLYLNNNFINNGSFSSNSGTTFFKSSTNDILTLSGDTGFVNFNNLQVDINGATKKGVSVADNFGVFVKNQVNLVSGDVRLTGEAQLIQSHSGLSNNIATSGKLLKDQQATSNVYGYNYWSSPVSNNSTSFSLNGGLFDGTDSSLNPFTPQQVLFNSGSPYNGVPSVLDGSSNVSIPLYVNDYWLYKYSPNTSGYAGWEKITKDTALLPGEGFTMKGTGVVSQNYVFKGLPNDGEYSFSINSGEFALLGNPYPSALDLDEFINDNLAIINKVQIWVDGGTTSHTLSTYLGGYSVYNLTGGVGPSLISVISGIGSASGIIPKQYMAVGQGFFVEATSNGTITFDNSQRAFQPEDGLDSNFYKNQNTKTNKSAENPDKFVRIGYEDPELFHRQLLLGFLPNSDADLSYNEGYDALMIDPREDEIFYIIENDVNQKYVIQGVGVYNNLYQFPIGLTITQEGNHTVMLDALENFTDPVYIKDSVLNTYYNLTESDFHPNLSAGEYLDRFYIVFQAPESLDNNDDVFNGNNISAYFNNNTIIIKNENLIEITHITVFNSIGQRINDLNETTQNENIVIPFVHQKGMYIVIIESGQNKKTFKIIN